MAIGFTELGTRIDTTPGATSEVSSSVTYTAGRHYWVFVTQVRQSSLDPDTPSLSGFGSTWNSVNDTLWTSSGTTRRRSTLFHCQASASGTGTVTASYTNQPANISFIIVESTDTSATGYVGTNVQTTTTNVAANTLKESLTMNAAASTDNRWLAFGATNLNPATFRLELDADTGGDADWTSGTNLTTGTSPVIASVAGWLNAAPATDTTPGYMTSGTSSSCFMIAIEVQKAAAATALPYWGVSAISGIALVLSGLGLSALGNSSLGGT